MDTMLVGTDYRNQFNTVDTTQAIWEVLYKVRIPQKYLVSINYLREFGLPSCGIKEVDEEQFKSTITTYMTIDKMVDLFVEGAMIYLIEPEAPKQIYQAISAHLEAWKSQVNNGINIGDAPYGDLLAMDMFANTVYEHARYHMLPRDLNHQFAISINSDANLSIFDTPFASMLPSKIQDRIKAGVNPLSPSHAPEARSPDRESLADVFKRGLNTTSINS